jgi:hypothetical protein
MNGINTTTADAGEAGPVTKAAEFFSDNEIFNLIKKGLSTDRNDEQKIPYDFKEYEWV